ncbi:helix-turn-helix domain-containing protein [Parvibaculum sp.]|jgi:ubiquinone biosynthesis protein COQ9|uniref:helix-turn-helix domain-containing protein n=1 Tax=Parvibaculum sp. TaxID=2024848 RepID=UPI003298D2F8
MAKKLDPEEKIVKAALRLAASRGWTVLSLADIAKTAKVSLSDLSKSFSSKAGILNAYGRRIDERVLQEVSAEDVSGETAQDRLFDVLMMRFDALSDDREALKRISADIRRDPLAAVPLARPLLQSMGWMLEAAGIDSSGIAGAMRVRGLAFIWGAAFRVWLEDDADQSKTMAELDRRLRDGSALLDRLSRLRPGGRQARPKEAA